MTAITRGPMPPYRDDATITKREPAYLNQWQWRCRCGEGEEWQYRYRTQATEGLRQHLEAVHGERP